MGKIGIPVLRLKAGYGGGKHSGNARSVAMEALKERYCKDPDLDRDLTEENPYLEDGFTSGKELADYWEQEAAEYRITDKNGKQKKLRSDASIGFAYIVKPDEEYMESLSEEDQMRMLEDAAEITIGIFRKRGLVIDAGVVHVDERNPHMHIFGHDPEYKLGKKIDIRLFGELNRDVPKLMRERGWDIQDCAGYDLEAVSQMTPEEKAEYTAKRIEEKKGKHGVSSELYKANKIAEQAAQRDMRTRERSAEVRLRDREVSKREQAVSEREEAAAVGLERARRASAAAEEKSRAADQERQRAAQERERAAQERERAQQERTANAALTQQLKAAIGDAETAKDAYGSVKSDSVLQEFFEKPVRSGGTIGDLYRKFVEDRKKTIAEQVKPRVERAKAVLSRATKRELPKGAEELMRKQHTKGDEYEF